MLKRIMLLCVTICLLSACAEDANQLRCNIGIMDITPDDSVVLAGFAARKGLSNSVHRPLKTHCLVIRNDTDTICIITNDMMELSPDFSDKLHKAISEQSGLTSDRIFIHCTHTHSAPRVGGSSTEPGGSNYRTAQMIFDNIVANAVQTIKAQKFTPFTIEIGKGSCAMNCNRREENGPIDHDVYIARFLDGKGKIIVSLVNYACHPVSLNHRSLAVSTDFPGITTEELSKQWGGEVFYFSGASGNVDPCGGLKADTAYTREKGMMLAEDCMKVKFDKLKKDNTLKISNKEVRLPFRIETVTADAINAHVDEILKWKVSETWENNVKGWQKEILDRISTGEVKNYLPFKIAGVNAGSLILLFSQGEPFNEYQSNLRKSLLSHPILFIAYTNGQNSYLPSRHAYETDEYEYEREQMHIYIKAPYPVSDRMPSVYESAIKEVIENVIN